MSSWNRIMECVPNFSEGRDLGKIEKIIEPFRARQGVIESRSVGGCRTGGRFDRPEPA